MEAAPGPNPTDLNALRLDVVRQAAEIYVKLAYPSGQVPEAVDRRMTWSPDVSPTELLSKPPSSGRVGCRGRRRRFTRFALGIPDTLT